MLKLLPKALRRPLHRAKPADKAPGASKEPTGTRLASPASRVRDLLAEIGARRILVHADAAAFRETEASLPGIACVWASNDLADIEQGAPHSEDLDWTGFDAAVCAGANLPRRYRQVLRLMAAQDPARPVFWIGGGFEFCGGTFSAPSGMDAVEGLLFNHFDAFFGVKDPLQFRIEVYHGPEVKRFYRILKPNQSMLVRLADHFPEARHPASLAVFVEHPVLTRDRHYRLRLCGDIFWQDSLTTIHSAHEFNRSPDHAFEFRLPAWLIRDGRAALTLPNYDRMTANGAEIETVAGAQSAKARRNPKHYLEQSVIPRDGLAGDRFFGWRYKGFGGSNWFAMESEQAVTGGHSANIAGNHHSSCPVLDRGNFAAGAEDLGRYERLQRGGFVLEPYALPIMPADGELRFGFEADGANPRMRDYRIDFFDGEGVHLGKLDYAKPEAGPLFPETLLESWAGPDRDRAKLLTISTDWLKAKLRFKGFKPMANLIAVNRRTGDRDVTEFQSSWRNLGVAVPGFPHWLTDELAVVGRTNVFGRARCDNGIRTGVLIVNASGRLSYHAKAGVSLDVFNNDGQSISAETAVPAFTWKLIWLDEVLPLASHLGRSAAGALLVRSSDADLNCQLVTTTPKGAVSLQHLWGY